MRIRFGPFAFDPQSRLLWRGGTEIALPPRVLGVLEVLLARAGQVVARQDLLDSVWKDAFVTDTSLAEAVSYLRQALGDDPQAPTYIQTVHRRGYRFLVTPQASDQGQTGVRLESDRGQTGVRLGSDQGQTGVRLGSDQGQTGVRLESDHVRQISHPPFTAHPEPPERHARVDWQLIPWSIAALCAGLAAATVWHMSTAKTPEPPPVSRFELRATPGTTFDRASDSLAISPDGRTFAWSACEAATGRCALYLRAIDHLDAQRLAGTEEGHSPVFSPDGRWIAFFADGALKKIAVAGGAATTLASAPDPAGAAWGRDGTIAFAGSAAGAVSAVNEQGGAVRTLTSPQTASGQLRDRDPAWLSDGALMFTVTRLPGMDSAGELAAVTRADPRSRTLRTGIVRAVPAGDYLLLATASGLQATTFDQRTLALGGSSDAVPAPGDGTPQCAAAAEVLAIVPSSGAARRVWADGADATPLARLTAMAIAPDSRRAAGVIVEGDAADIWLADLDSGALTRLTFGGSSISPVWSADGRHVLYATRTSNGPYTVVSRAVENRNGPPAPVAGAPAAALPTSAAGDGRIAITTYAADALHLVVALLAPGAAPRVLTDGPFDESNAVFSPDGRWLALESTESGRTEIVVRSATDGHRIAISAGGGRTPRWSQDGHAVYYESGRRLMRAAFSPDAASHTPAETILDRAGERAVAVTPSGRVLIERRPDADTAIVVQQWLRELRDRLPLPVNAPR